MEKNREYYIAALQQVFKKENRLPKKSDFSVEDVNRIKGYFGPWPWALEEAGLKESKKEERKLKNAERHLRSRERRKEAKSKANAKKEGNVL